MTTRTILMSLALLSLAVSMSTADEVVFDRQFILAKNNPVNIPLPNPPDRSMLGVLNSEGVYLCAAIYNLDRNESVNQNHARATAQFLADTRPQLPTTIMTSQYRAQTWEQGDVTYEVIVDLINVQFHSVNYGLQFTPTVHIRIIQR